MVGRAAKHRHALGQTRLARGLGAHRAEERVRVVYRRERRARHMRQGDEIVVDLVVGEIDEARPPAPNCARSPRRPVSRQLI